ncbi:2-methylcitrate dehydratase [Ruegeria sp. ANG-S4]|uniref:MmgE/PrpD family protein n=1 Tax=Ruegeria sp. ANG-S4 TaxID=1577904 RepID=UPI00057C4CA6|nr:MmgE/PrpD family protein [Ruegeria sp. ANG-S4]KIC45089.1 2-methylcitrate dehydratase [Ruegeria sp. ANG-S4]
MTNAFPRIADFALACSADQMPDEVKDAAALMMLDTMGVLIGAGPMEAGVIARNTAALLYSSSSPDHSARMLFDGRQVSMAGAAYAAATQTDNLDAHDGYNPTKGHIGVVIIPALAALAEHCPDLSGPEALAAVVVGYEVAGRAGLALHDSVSDYHTSGAWNALGVAAMSARLRGHAPDQLRQAFGIAEYHGPRSQMMREIANPTMLHDGSGWGAMVGLSASILAEQGFTGAPALTVEEDRSAVHWQDLGTFWQMEHQYVKPYPICRWAHAAIDGTRQLMLDHDLTHDQIATLHINSFHEAACLFSAVPATTSQAQYSLAFAVASFAVHGRIGVEQISGSGLSDPVVANVVSRITVAEDARHSQRFPQGRWADVVIETVDGRLLKSGDIHARGGPEAPLKQHEVIDKFMDFSTPTVGEARAVLIRDAILELTRPNALFSDLEPLLYDPP